MKISDLRPKNKNYWGFSLSGFNLDIPDLKRIVNWLNLTQDFARFSKGFFAFGETKAQKQVI